jgi:hypothetical protein
MRRECRIHVRIDYNFNFPVSPLNLELEPGVVGAVYVAGIGEGIHNGRNAEYGTTLYNEHKHGNELI